MSQHMLAERAGVDRSYLAGIEAGQRNPSLDVMHKLAVAMGADESVFFSGGESST